MDNFNSIDFEYQVLGLDAAIKSKLESLTGEPANVGYLVSDDKTAWSKTENMGYLERLRPMFITTTFRSWVGDQAHHLAGGIWVDLDAQDIDDAVSDAKDLAGMLTKRDIDPLTCSLFASGGKGFHVYIPADLLGVAYSLTEASYWGRICKGWVQWCVMVDTLDASLYCGGNGKIFRQANVLRSNGAFKVPMPWSELEGTTTDRYHELCSAPRPFISPQPVERPAKGAAEAWAQAKADIQKSAPKPAKRRATEVLTRQDEAKLGRALTAIRGAVADGSLGYEDWLRVGSALKGDDRITNGLELWAWVSQPHKGHRDRNAAGRWDGLRGGCTLGTVFHIAREIGGAA